MTRCTGCADLGRVVRASERRLDKFRSRRQTSIRAVASQIDLRGVRTFSRFWLPGDSIAFGRGHLRAVLWLLTLLRDGNSFQTFHHWR
jgi:hypothetical protein